MQGEVPTKRQLWESADPEVVDPAPPWHVLQLVWDRLPEDDEREATELLDIDPAPLNPLPSTVQVGCVLDPAVVADADIRWLHRGPLARTTPGGIPSRSWGRPCPTPRASRQQSGVEGRGLSGSPVSAGATCDACQRQGPGCPFPALASHGSRLLASRVRLVVQAAGPPRRCGRPLRRTKSSI